MRREAQSAHVRPTRAAGRGRLSSRHRVSPLSRPGTAPDRRGRDRTPMPATMSALEPLRLVARQVGIGEGEHEELVRVVRAIGMRVVDHRGQEVVVVGDKQGVLALAIDGHIRTEGQALELGRDRIRSDAVRAERGHEVEEVVLAHGRRGERIRTAQLADLLRVAQVDVEQVLERRLGVVAEALAVALVDQELVVVDRHDLADAGVLGLARAAEVGQRVGVLAHPMAGQVDAHDAGGGAILAAVLQQRALHDAVERAAVRRDRQAFHALVGDAADGVAGDLLVARSARSSPRRTSPAAGTTMVRRPLRRSKR